MFKLVVFFSLFISNILASNYNFIEYRYSHAIDDTIKLKGIISFKDEGLIIKYSNDKLIQYEYDRLIIEEDYEPVNISYQDEERIKEYLQLIMLLHNDDSVESLKIFNISKLDNLIVLKPKNDLKEYISKIELLKIGSELKRIKFFIFNDDTISIVINNEVR